MYRAGRDVEVSLGLVCFYLCFVVVHASVSYLLGDAVSGVVLDIYLYEVTCSPQIQLLHHLMFFIT